MTVVIDAHAHLFLHQRPETLIRSMDRDGVNISAVSAHVWCPSHYAEQRVGNDYIAAALRKYPDRIIGFAYVSPTHSGVEEALAEMKRAVGELGFKGLKLHPVADFFPANDPKYVHPLVEQAIKLRLPIFIHSGNPPMHYFCHPITIGDLAEAFPDATIMLGHIGQSQFGDAISVAKRCTNIMLETSTAQRRAIDSAVKRVGADRLLFGTDTDWIEGGTQLLLRVINSLDMSEEERNMILWENAAKMFKIDGGRSM